MESILKKRVPFVRMDEGWLGYSKTHQSLFVKSYQNEPLGKGETIVFLHEGLGSVAQWRDFPRLIGEYCGCNVFMYDRFGHGNSSAAVEKRGVDYLEMEAWTILPALLEHYSIKNPILVGHSDGGSIALLYASRFPVKKLITEAAHIFVESVTLEGIREAMTRKTGLIDKLKAYHGDKTEDLWSSWADTWLSDGFKSWNIEAHLKNITCPSLIIQGEKDPYGTNLQVERIISGIGAHAEALLIPNIGHTPHYEAKEIVQNALIDFCKNANT
jgi:pimeloyl-ACP methyl ester carboxylesterase